MGDFHAGKALHIKLWIGFMDGFDNSQIMLESPSRMQPADHMEPGKVRVLHGICHQSQSLLLCHFIGALFVAVPAKSAELAMGCTDIGQIYVTVYVIVDDIPAFPLPYHVRHSPQPGQVVTMEQAQAVLTGEPLSPLNFFLYILIFFCR